MHKIKVPTMKDIRSYVSTLRTGFASIMLSVFVFLAFSSTVFAQDVEHVEIADAKNEKSTQN